MIAEKEDAVYAKHVNLCYTDVIAVKGIWMERLEKRS